MSGELKDYDRSKPTPKPVRPHGGPIDGPVSDWGLVASGPSDKGFFIIDESLYGDRS